MDEFAEGLREFDESLERALIERDGFAPTFEDRHWADLPLSILERDVIIDALERFEADTEDFEDRGIAAGIRGRIDLM